MEAINMKINIQAQSYLENFKKTGTLGEGAERKQIEGMDAMLAVMTKSNTFADIVQLDNSAGDTNSAVGYINLLPEAARESVPSGFGEVTSYEAEFKGSADDPDELLVAYDGPESHHVFYGAVPSPDEPIIFFEAMAKGDKGLIAAMKCSNSDGVVNGYAEMLEIPWHLAR